MRDRLIRCLDEECLRAIFGCLPAQSLASAACVCREWRNILSDDAAWYPAHETCDSDDYRRNSGTQLADIAAGRFTLPLTPPPPRHAMPCHAMPCHATQTTHASPQVWEDV